MAAVTKDVAPEGINVVDIEAEVHADVVPGTHGYPKGGLAGRAPMHWRKLVSDCSLQTGS